eukprot:SAG11_NODE_1655_length_4504_cov_31.952100_5_plen_69_part_00
MVMGVRATLVGGKGLKANRRCGRSTAGAVGAVEVGSKIILTTPVIILAIYISSSYERCVSIAVVGAHL